jgi:hypothetical protein
MVVGGGGILRVLNLTTEEMERAAKKVLIELAEHSP